MAISNNDLLFDPRAQTVMIVDDHDPIRKGIKRVLLAMGIGDVIECFDGEDALKVLAKNPVDLMILDLYMRNVSGFDVLEHIGNRDIACEIPVIVVTGEASKEEIVKVADMGAEDYVLKPFQAQDLEKKVVKTLNKFYSPTPLLRALRQAERLYLAKDYRTALTTFDAALRLDPQSARAAHGKALTLARVGRGEEAIQLLNDNIQANLSYHKNHGAIADLLLQAGQRRPAIESMRHELEINPKQPNRQIHLAKLLLKEGDAMGAVDHFRVALQEDPKRLNALMGMGQAYAMADNLDKALYYFKRVRRYHPAATKALEAAVQCAMAANEPRKAEMLLRDEKAARPERLDTYVLLAMFYVKSDREDDALAVADELLAQDPTNAHGHKLKGSLLLKKKDYAGAFEALSEVAKIAPTAEILTSMGETLVALQRIPEAMEALNKAVALNPDSAVAFQLLADAHRMTSQWLKASLLYRRAAQLGANKERCMAEARECAQQVAARRARLRAAG